MKVSIIVFEKSTGKYHNIITDVLPILYENYVNYPEFPDTYVELDKIVKDYHFGNDVSVIDMQAI